MKRLIGAAYRAARQTYLDSAVGALAGIGLLIWLRIGFESWFGLYVMVLMGVCIAYGFIRVAVSYPVLNGLYGRWLLTTPWEPGEPLPMGPVRLVWQDAVFVALASVATPFPAPYRFVVPAVLFGLGYVGGAITVARDCRLLRQTLAIGVLAMPAGLWLEGGTRLAAWSTIAGLLLVLADRSVRRGVNGLRLPGAKQLFKTDLDDGRTAAAGAPAKFLLHEQPKEPGRPEVNGITDAVLWGLVTAWVVYWASAPPLSYFLPLENLTADERWRGITPVYLVAAAPSLVAGVYFRLTRYCGRHWPPISLLGRVATGRLILRDYDYVYLATITTVLASLGLPPLLWSVGVPEPLAIAASAGLAMTLALALPPSLDDWRHTGGHSIRVAGPILQTNARPTR